MWFRKFFLSFIKNHKEIWSIIPSSQFLAKKMVDIELIKNSNVIIELGAWTWAFTKKLLDNIDFKTQRVFIIEKDIELYNSLIKKIPQYKDYIYNLDVLNIEELLEKNNIKTIDLIISGLPFKSLPLEIKDFVFNDICKKFFNKSSFFIQFSYFKSSKKIFSNFFSNIHVEQCILNLPRAFVFKMTNIKKILKK